jgi:hypothetical protein
MGGHRRVARSSGLAGAALEDGDGGAVLRTEERLQIAPVRAPSLLLPHVRDRHATHDSQSGRDTRALSR